MAHACDIYSNSPTASNFTKQWRGSLGMNAASRLLLCSPALWSRTAANQIEADRSSPIRHGCESQMHIIRKFSHYSEIENWGVHIIHRCALYPRLYGNRKLMWANRQVKWKPMLLILKLIFVVGCLCRVICGHWELQRLRWPTANHVSWLYCYHSLHNS